MSKSDFMVIAVLIMAVLVFSFNTVTGDAKAKAGHGAYVETAYTSSILFPHQSHENSLDRLISQKERSSDLARQTMETTHDPRVRSMAYQIYQQDEQDIARLHELQANSNPAIALQE